MRRALMAAAIASTGLSLACNSPLTAPSSLIPPGTHQSELKAVTGYAGEFTVDNANRLRQFLRRDLLQRDHPTMTFRTGDITTSGTLTCESCGWTLRTMRTTMLPPCPQCSETTFRKTY